MMDIIETLPSFRQFDYRLRPNKGAERRMLIETFRRLSFFEPIKNYRYIGFGSTTFSDFILMHRALNITDMISIEKRIDYQLRFDFNKPFSCVSIKYGDSTEILPQLSWDMRVIVWLDYDGRLTNTVMQDISYVSSCVSSGSMLIVTVNSEGYHSPWNMGIKKINKKLRSRFEYESGFTLPAGTEGKHLQGIEMANTCRRLIEEKIEITLRDRNGLQTKETQMQYRPFLNFVYRDGAQMLTVGSIFYYARDESILSKCRFKDLGFTTSKNDELYQINLPVMTTRERHYLDQRLPADSCDEALNIGLKQDEIENYIRLYRYCPSFAEVELI